LEAIERGQRAQQSSDAQMQAQLTTQAPILARLPTWHQRSALALGALGVRVLALGGLGGWQLIHRPEMAYAQAVGAVDATLVQPWGTLPKAAQEQLPVIEGRLGLARPSQRK
jgi:hypothetical protein